MKLERDRQERTMAKAREIFLREAGKHLQKAQQALSELEANGYDPKICAELYRFAHTLKGSGFMVDLKDIAEPAFEILTALALVENYQVEFGPGLKRFLAKKVDDIKEAVTRLSYENAPSYEEIASPHFCETKQILVVDDDSTITDLVKSRLEQEGFDVTVCQNTLQAEQSLRLQKPDLILLDILMPGENGIDFCRRIRSTESHHIIPIIFFTVKGELQDKLLGFATGADDYLAKPFDMKELLARIHAILRRIDVYHDLAWRDELTGVYNRRYLDRRLKEELFRATTSRSKFTIAMIDLDEFKNINDTYGHSAGDQVLKQLANRMVQAFRTTDIICRFGGDEFVVIFPENSSQLADLALKRLQNELASNPIILLNEKTYFDLALSIGMSSFPEDGCTMEDLLAAADAAMYRNKQSDSGPCL